MLGLSIVEDPKPGLQSLETLVREMFIFESCFWGSARMPGRLLIGYIKDNKIIQNFSEMIAASPRC
jgi:hypothetical protein